ncbi:MAG: carbon-nitrogen hydrolase family protein [Candidatus Latescibacteria bacterium]|nr:carbon-nitrogen hydrolase family protein [Candidatus Latescibacterota bacterium]
MSEFRIGLVSTPVQQNGFSCNLKRIQIVLEERANDDADVFVFGEAALTGLNIVDVGSIDDVDRSEILRKVNRLTKDFSTAICIGFIEREAGRFYHAHCLSSEGAVCGIQRKVFAGNPTRPHVFSSGKEIRPIPFRGSQVAILARADWMLPETVLAAGQHEPDLILAPTDQYFWNPHNRSILHKAGQSASFWLQAPLVAAFNSTSGSSDEDTEVFACLAFDCTGDEKINASKKVGESTVHTVDVELQKAHRKWGGFQERKRYLDYVWNSPK